MSNLTSQSLFEMVREFHKMYPPEPSPFRDLFRPLVPEFGGLKVYEKPPPPPKIQLSAECAELVGAEFANRVNAWLFERFGAQPDSIYFISGLGIAMSKRNMAIIQNVTS